MPATFRIVVENAWQRNYQRPASLNLIGVPLLHRLIVLFILTPLVEVYLLITVGNRIGAPLTIALILLTATLGVALLRYQGLCTLTAIKDSLRRGQLPAVTLLEGVLIIIAGALLLTPGFATDAIGFTCLVPKIRNALATTVLRYYMTNHKPRSDDGEIIDVEYWEDIRKTDSNDQ